LPVSGLLANHEKSHLILRAIEWLNRLAKRHGISLRQSFLRLATRAQREIARLWSWGPAKQKARHMGGSIGLTVWGGARLWTAAEDFQLDRDTREQRQHDAGGDHADGGLHRGAANQTDAVEQGSQVADIERRFFTIEANIGQCAFRAFFGSARQHGLELYIGCWQTNSNSSPLGQWHCPLCREKIAPLGESSGTVPFENIATGEAAFLVEVVRDGGVDGGDLLKTSHPPEAEHRALPPSKWEV